jgi:hypothetical protein
MQTTDTDTDSDEGCIGAIVGAAIVGVAASVIAFVGIAFGTVVDGFITLWLWKWFAEPLGAPAIGFALACGISVLMTHLTTNTPIFPEEKDNTTEKLKLFGHNLLRSGLLLLTGYIIHLLM